MITVEYTIETRWSCHGYTGEVEIAEDDIEGMTEAEQNAFIEGTVAEAVDNDVSWGWAIKK